MVMLQDGCYVLNMAHVSSDLQVPIFLKNTIKEGFGCQQNCGYHPDMMAN